MHKLELQLKLLPRLHGTKTEYHTKYPPPQEHTPRQVPDLEQTEAMLEQVSEVGLPQELEARQVPKSTGRPNHLLWEDALRSLFLLV